MMDLWMFGYANAVIPFNGDPVPLIRAINPDVVIRGEDQRIESETGAIFLTIPRLPGISTTQILQSHATP